VSATRVAAWAASCVLMLLAFSAAAYEREKTDVVSLRNGDRVTGEILSLQYGILAIKTSDMGTINIEWPAIQTVTSRYTFFFERIGGMRYYGTIHTGESGRFVVGEAQDAQEMTMPDVTRLSQVEEGFWQRISGNLAVGYNYTKSSDISVGSLSFNSTYRAPGNESTLRASALRTQAPDTGETDRDQIAFVMRFLRPAKNYWLLLSSLERNEELGIDGRLQLGGALGRRLMQRPDSEISAILGLAFTQEWATGEKDSQSSIEGVLGGEWRIFRFSKPETSLNSSFVVYPSLTESGRYRSELNITLSRDIIEDLTLDLSYYNSYDSEPPDVTASKTDYGIVTSLGYKF
jgi:putative salt-induced outer membrane protein YdiY